MKPISTLSLLLLAILIALPLSHIAAGEKCRYNGKTSVYVSYANAKMNPDLDDSPTINLGFDENTNANPFIMDTGSCGITTTSEFFQPGPDAKNLGPGTTEYTNGTVVKMLSGDYWTATQKIYDRKGNLVATAEVPVLLVTSEVDITPCVGTSPINTNPTGFALMGIGFGREGIDLPLKTPKYNAFLNLTSVLRDGKLKPLPKDWTNGYIVHAEGVTLGLTAENTKNAGFVKLTPWEQFSTDRLPEWMPMPVAISVNGICSKGTSVMDTGITGAIITTGADLGTLVNCPGTTTPSCVGNGNVISVYYPDKKNAVAHYSFTIGQTGNPMQPNQVAVQTRDGVYWNTSRHFLGGMNFIYDNKHGYAGFIWNGNTNGRYGFVIPSK